MQCDPECIFCKIIAGEIPCCKLYEDDKVISFMDINPVSKGHFLVIPKYHASLMHELPEDYSSLLLPVLSKIVGACELKNYNIVVNNGKESGQAVPHVHIHVIPAPSVLSKSIIEGAGKTEGADIAKLSEFAKGIFAKLM